MLHIPLREKKSLLLLLLIIMSNPKFLTESHIVVIDSKAKGFVEMTVTEWLQT